MSVCGALGMEKNSLLRGSRQACAAESGAQLSSTDQLDSSTRKTDKHRGSAGIDLEHRGDALAAHGALPAWGRQQGVGARPGSRQRAGRARLLQGWQATKRSAPPLLHATHCTPERTPAQHHVAAGHQGQRARVLPADHAQRAVCLVGVAAGVPTRCSRRRGRGRRRSGQQQLRLRLRQDNRRGVQAGSSCSGGRGWQGCRSCQRRRLRWQHGLSSRQQVGRLAGRRCGHGWLLALRRVCGCVGRC